MLISYTIILFLSAAHAYSSEDNYLNASVDLLDSIQLEQPLGPAYQGPKDLCRATNAFPKLDESQCPYPASMPTDLSTLEGRIVSRGEAKNEKDCAKTCLFAGSDTCKALAFNPEDGRCIHFSVPLEDVSSSRLGKEIIEGAVMYNELLRDTTYSIETLWPVECWALDCSGLFVGAQLELREEEQSKRIRAYWTPERMAAAQGA